MASARSCDAPAVTNLLCSQRRVERRRAKSAGFLIASAHRPGVAPNRWTPNRGNPNLHRLLVDTLHARLVNKGRLDESLSPDKVKSLHAPSDDELDRWFKDGLKLRMRREQRSEKETNDSTVEVHDA